MVNPIIVLEVFDLFQKSLRPTTSWKPLGDGWHQEPPTPQAVARAKVKGEKAQGKQWQIHEFANDDSARVAHIINQLMPKAPEGKLVIHNDKIALAREAVPQGYKKLEGQPAERHRERMAGLHALLNTSPEHFEHFAPKGDDSAGEVRSRSTGKGLFNHLNEQKDWVPARHLVSHLAGQIPSEGLTRGVKDAVQLSDDRLEDAIGDAGLVPEHADSLLERLKSRREDLRKLLASGELPGDSNENKAFADKYDPESYERGPLVGAPPNIKTPKDREALKKQLGQLADKGAFGAGWYRDSAQAVHDRFGGNLPKIQKYLALLAAYSPQSTPNPNTEAAERAWQHHEAGLPKETLRGGGTNEQDDQARALLYHNHWHSGLKTNAFYRNLMHYIKGGTDRPPTADEMARGELQPVTVDRWAARSIGYPIQLGESAQEGEAKERTVSPSNYRFSRQILNEVAHEKKLSAHELQERMWVAEKGGALARKNLIANYAKAKGESVKDLTKQVNAGNIPAGLARPLKNIKIDPKAMTASKESFATGLHELGGHVVSDLTPDPSMLDTSQHSHEHRQELHNRLLEALHQDKRLRAAELLGVGGAPAKVGASGHLYAGAVMPRSLISVAAQEGVPSGDLALMRGQITPNSLRRIRGMAHGLAHLLGQKSVEFHRPINVQGFRKEDLNGTNLKTGELAPHELHALQQAISQKLGTPTVPVPYGDGVYVVNHSGRPNDDFHEAVKATANEVLNQPQVSTIGGAAGRQRRRPDIDAGRFYASGERLEDTSEGHRQRAVASLGPALSGRFFAEHAPLLRPVYEQYAREHGVPLNLPSAYSAGEEEPKKKARKKVAALARAWGWLTRGRVEGEEPFATRDPNEAREPSNVRDPDDEREPLSTRNPNLPREPMWGRSPDETRDTLNLRPRFLPTLVLKSWLLPDAEEEVEGEVQKSGGRAADFFSSAPLTVLSKSIAPRPKARKPPGGLSRMMYSDPALSQFDMTREQGYSNPWYKLKAVRHKGVTYLGANHPSDHHEFIADRIKRKVPRQMDMSVPAVGHEKANMQYGFIGHDHRFYTMSEMEDKVKAGETTLGKSLLIVLEKSEVAHVLHYQQPGIRLPGATTKEHHGMMIGTDKDHNIIASLHYDHYKTPGEKEGSGIHVASLQSSSPFAGADLMKHIVHHAARNRAELHGTPVASGSTGRVQNYYHHLVRRYGGASRAELIKPEGKEDIRHIGADAVKDLSLAPGMKPPQKRKQVKVSMSDYQYIADRTDPGKGVKIHPDKPLELYKGHGNVNTSGVNTRSRTEEEKRRRARDPMIDPDELENTPWYNDSVKKSLNDPYIAARALKHTPSGRVWQLPEHETHLDGVARLSKQHGLDHEDWEGGYVGHDGLYYNYEQLGDRMEAHSKWNRIRRGQRIKFNDGQAVKFEKSLAVVLAKAAKIIPFPTKHPFEAEAKKYGAKPEEYARVHKFYVGDPEKIDNYYKNIKPVWNKSARRKLHYRKTFQGFDISIENRPGSYRHWTHPDGRPGKTLMRRPYGYIKNSEGLDGDHVDVFLGPNEQSPTAYIIHQLKAPDFTTFDEDKVILGADSAAEAQRIYLDHYDDPRFFGGMTAMPLGEFRQKVFATEDQPQMIKSFLYHATLSPNLGGIVKHGLLGEEERPREDGLGAPRSNWHFSDNPENKVWLADKRSGASYYGKIAARNHANNYGYKPYVPMLRVNKKHVEGLEDRGRGEFVGARVHPQHLEIHIHGQWHPLTGGHPAIESIAGHEWDEETEKSFRKGGKKEVARR